MATWENIDKSALAESVLACTSPEELAAALKEQGIELDDAAAQAAFDEVQRMEPEQGQLSDDQLETVGGGIRLDASIEGIIGLIKKLLAGESL